MPGAPKRIPGESNADYGARGQVARSDPTIDHSGWDAPADLSWVMRLSGVIVDKVSALRGKGAAGRDQGSA